MLLELSRRGALAECVSVGARAANGEPTHHCVIAGAATTAVVAANWTLNQRSEEPMGALFLIPVLISCLLAAAHFLRADNLLMVFVCCAAPLLLIFRHPWATRLLQVMLCLAALEWMRTLLAIIQERQETG